MQLESIIGILASVFTASSLLPQLIKLVQTKKAGDISLMMLITLFMGIAFWIYYGFLKQDWIIIISNSVSLLLNISIVILTVIHKNRSSSNEPATDISMRHSIWIYDRCVAGQFTTMTTKINQFNSLNQLFKKTLNGCKVAMDGVLAGWLPCGLMHGSSAVK